MRELGYISEAEEQEARSQPVKALPALRSRRVAPYFVDYVHTALKDVVEESNPTQRNLKIFTGLDPEYQQCADQAVDIGLKRLDGKGKTGKKRAKTLQAALISAVPSSGQILSWVGGRNYGQNQFDRVSLAKRQPGSAFKPFVYLTALDSDLNRYRVARTTSILVDEPTTIEIAGVGSWTPENYDREFRGEVTVREALARSLNIPAVSLASKVGIQSVKQTAELFGLGEDLPAVPSLALGSVEVTPLQLTQAFAGLANGGVLRELKPIQGVVLDNQVVTSVSKPPF
jgi:penicillin-binding protein 1B